MTNGHWDTRREKEKQADVLYAQGKTEEADYLLGKQLHPDYIPVSERVTEPEPIPPSEPTPPIISPQIQKIIDDWHTHKLILPSWFANNNINWVINGHITESEFLKGFNDLLHDHIAYYVTEPTPPPITEPVIIEEPEVPEQMQFLCSDVYTLDNGSVVKTNYPTLSVPQIQNFISQGLMVRDCGTPSPTVSEVRSHYGFVPEVPVEEVPEVPVETTDDIPPPTDEEPEQMQFLCSDVYTLDNGSVVKTSYPTLSVPQIQNFISQGLMVRDCGTPSPTVNEVRSHYGYTVEEPVGPEVPTEKFVVSKPGRLTMSDMTNTNAWVGILIAGTLAVPVFSSILSKKK